MFDTEYSDLPMAIKDIEQAASSAGFTISSDVLTGSLLRTLAATKPGGALLELGTGMGMGTAWIVEGMDVNARLLTVDNNADRVAVGRRYLGHDERVTFHVEDGVAFIEAARARGDAFDFIFADTWPGKFRLLDETLSLLKPGGLYIIDDLLPQASWPQGHEHKVAELMAVLERRKDLRLTKLNWSTGLIIGVKVA